MIQQNVRDSFRRNSAVAFWNERAKCGEDDFREFFARAGRFPIAGDQSGADERDGGKSGVADGLFGLTFDLRIEDSALRIRAGG